MPLPTTRFPAVRIAGKDIREYGIELTAYPSILLPPVRPRQETVAGRHGAIDYGGQYDVWPFTLQAQIRGTDHQDFLSKKNDFLAWIDLAPRVTQEFLVGQRSIRPLAFELSAHEYQYTTGTVDVTNGSKKVTKNAGNTYWKWFAFPGAKFTVAGDTTRYTVVNVTDDDTLYLDQNMVRATGTALAYTLERKRYLMVNYSGTSDISNISVQNAQFVDTIFPISVSFEAVYPFWVGETFDETFDEAGSSVATKFQMLRGLGNSPFQPVYQFVGAATNPQIVVAKHAFMSNLDNFDTSGVPTNARAITNDAELTANIFTNSVARFAGILSQGLSLHGNTLQTEGDDFTFSSMFDGSTPPDGISDRLNLSTGTVSMWIRPWWDGNDGKEHTLFNAVDNAFFSYVDLIKLSTNVLQARHSNSTTTLTATITLDGTKLPAGIWSLIVMRWDVNAVIDGSSNFLQVDIVNGIASEGGQTSVLGSPIDVSPTFAVGHNRDITLEHSSIDALVDDMCIWDIPIDDADITTLYGSGSPTRGADQLHASNILAYYDFDGIVDTAIGAAPYTNFAAQRSRELPSSATTTTTTVVGVDATGVFATSDRFTLFDRTGFKAESTISSFTTTTITDDTINYGALTNADLVGVHGDLSSASSQYFSTADHVNFDITGDLSISAWINVDDATPATEMVILSKFATTGNQRSYTFNFKTDGELQFVISSDGTAGNTTAVLSTNASFVAGKWYHVAVVYDTDGAGDNESATFYVNGTVLTDDATALKSAIFNSTAELRIGSTGDGANYFNGKIRDVAIYNSALTASSILTIAQAPLVQFGTPVSWWKLTDAAAVTAPNDDSSAGNNHDLTLNGGTTTNYGTHSRTQLAYISKDLMVDGDMNFAGIGMSSGLVGTPTSVVKNAANAKGGFGALAIGVNAGSEGIEQTVVTATGNDFVLRWWGKGSTTGIVRIQLVNAAAGNIDGTTGTENDVASTSYVFQERCFDADDASVDVRLISGTAATYTAYYDGVQLLPNLVNDGGFEGAFTGGLNDNWTTGGDTYTEEVTSIHSGGKAQGLTSTISRIIQQITTLVLNEWYQLSIWARDVAGNNGTLRVFLDTIGGSGSPIDLVPITSALTATYTRFTVIFQYTDATRNHLWVRGDNGIFVDDVSVVHMPSIAPTITAMDEGYNWVPTKLRHGVHVRSGSKFQYAANDTVANLDQIGVAARIIPQFPSDIASNGNYLIFEMLYQNNDRFYLQFNASAAAGTDGNYELIMVSGGTTKTLSATAVSFVAGDYLEIGAYSEAVGGGKFLINGIDVTNTNETWTAITAGVPHQLAVGGQFHATTHYESNFIFDGLLLFAQNPTEDELVSIFTEGLPFKNMSRTIKYTGTLAIADILDINLKTGQHRLQDSSAKTRSAPGSNVSGTGGWIQGNTAEESVLYIPNTIEQLRIIGEPTWR